MPSSLSPASLLRTAGFVQQRRLMALHTPLGADRLLAERLLAREHLDEGGFALTLTALSDDADIPLKELLGKAVRVDLQTADGTPRVFHGHVTRFALLASNGGFARYELVIEPWLAYLRWRQDSFLFQDQSVFDIVDSVLADYAGVAALDPQWRWDVADRSIYPRRGITTQYRETDYAFVTRLLAEEGLFHWFEHTGDGGAGEGRHTLVIADHPGAFAANRQGRVAFHRADVTETEDSIQRWQAARRLQTNRLSRQSWDYKSVSARPAELASQHANSAARIELAWDDDPGVYAWEDGTQGERLLANALQALEVRNKRFEGESTVRSLAPATTFVLDDHHAHADDAEDERRFAVLAVTHEARNNFDEDLRRAVDEALGPLEETDDDAPANAGADVPFYRNRFTAVRATIPYRPLTRDGHGARIRARPTMHGSHTAIVIGTAGKVPVHTDRDHRIKVQFHWQRGGGGSARQSHPAGDDNAPGTDRLGAWVRVAAAAAGDNWGQVTVPRVGQEVLVEYLNGDIDRPVVVGGLYNGAGARDAQHNDKRGGAAGATGNAPAWFAGEQGEHAHPAVFSGIKTQALSASQDGTGGFNQLLFDDTPGQARLALSTTQADARLMLGHHVLQQDNQRGAGRGHGAELATSAQGAIRGGAGVLLSADEQREGEGGFMDSEPAHDAMTQAFELASTLAKAAQDQRAGLDGEPAPAELPALAALQSIATTQSATATGGSAQTGAQGEGFVAAQGGDGTVPAYDEPLLQISAPKGIAAFTPREAVLVSGESSSVVAGGDLNVAAQGQLSVGVANGLSIYTRGAAASGGDPNDETGIRLHAANGPVALASLTGPSTLAAQHAITIASTGGAVTAQGKSHLLATAGGAFVRLEGSSVQIHAPGAVTFRASAHKFVGPGTAKVEAPQRRSALTGCAKAMEDAAGTGAAV